MFYELCVMFEELFPDADRLNLEEMQRRLERNLSLLPAPILFCRPLHRRVLWILALTSMELAASQSYSPW